MPWPVHLSAAGGGVRAHAGKTFCKPGSAWGRHDPEGGIRRDWTHIMQVYLPIAEISVNLYLLLGLGGIVGFLSGMFGVGGGFLMTPMLMMIGIPPAVAVATEANQIVASSVSGAIAQYRRGNVDIRMGLVLLAGGVIGSVFGVQLVKLLREMGQIDLVIKLTYITMLSIIGSMMFIESLNALRRAKAAKESGKGRRTSRRAGTHSWVHGLPLRMRFPRSKLYISIIPPVLVGVAVGLLAAIMGVGGGFIMVPAMIYLLRMPTGVVVGTSLFQIGFVTIITTILNAVQNQTVDIVLALILMSSAVIGAQIGARVGAKLPGEQLRVLLALMVLAMCVKLAWGLIVTPSELFSFAAGGE